MKLEKIQVIDLKNYVESNHDGYIYNDIRYRTMYVEITIDGVTYHAPLKNGCEISYPKNVGKNFKNDHTIVKYDIFLWDYTFQHANYRITIYADLGQEDPANPDPEKIYFIQNEEKLKKYIDDLIYEEENPWWDREEE